MLKEQTGVNAVGKHALPEFGSLITDAPGNCCLRAFAQNLIKYVYKRLPIARKFGLLCACDAHRIVVLLLGHTDGKRRCLCLRTRFHNFVATTHT